MLPAKGDTTVPRHSSGESIRPAEIERAATDREKLQVEWSGLAWPVMCNETRPCSNTVRGPTVRDLQSEILGE